jgi:hypothetical protein
MAKRVHKYSPDGDALAGTELGRFLAPHGLAVDLHGDICVGEVSWTA